MKRDGGNNNFMVRKVGTTSGNGERNGPAAHRGNGTVRKPRIVRFLTCPSVHVRAPPSAVWKHTKGREEEVGEKRGYGGTEIVVRYRRREWKRNG